MNARATNVVGYGFSSLLLTVLCAVLIGCSRSPSADDGERAIQDRITQESEGRIKLTMFQKDNGAQGESMGFKIYRLEFTAEVECTEDCKWVTGFLGSQLSFQTTKPPTENHGGMAAFMEASQNPGEIVMNGQRAHLSGTINFVKKEKGWAVDGMELTKANLETTLQPRQQSKGSSTETRANDPTMLANADSKAAAQKNTCINNLRIIDGATQQWALENGKLLTDTPTVDDLLPYLKRGGMDQFPSCPAGGVYKIDQVGERPICSIAGHSLNP